jgi:hypothetical protein
VVRALGDLEAVVHDAQVHEVELVAEHILAHVLVLLPVGRDDVVPLALEPPRDVRRDEPARPRDRDPQPRLWPVLLPVQVGRRVRPKASIARHGYHKKPKPTHYLPLDPENNLLNPNDQTWNLWGSSGGRNWWLLVQSGDSFCVPLTFICWGRRRAAKTTARCSLFGALFGEMRSSFWIDVLIYHINPGRPFWSTSSCCLPYLPPHESLHHTTFFRGRH